MDKEFKKLLTETIQLISCVNVTATGDNLYVAPTPIRCYGADEYKLLYIDGADGKGIKLTDIIQLPNNYKVRIKHIKPLIDDLGHLEAVEVTTEWPPYE